MRVYSPSQNKNTTFKKQLVGLPDGLLKDFLFDGRRVRYELIDPFIKKLRRILEAIEDSKEFFDFMACSVLLTFNGVASLKTSEVDARLIDFEHTTVKLPGVEYTNSTSQKGILNLIKGFEGLRNKVSLTDMEPTRKKRFRTLSETRFRFKRGWKPVPSQ